MNITNREYIEYLQLLSTSYPSISTASNEIIKLESLCHLPKPTEHFLSDIHGEYDTFIHILNSGSGVIRNRIDEIFPDYSEERKQTLATIIYYPKKKLTQLEKLNKLDEKYYIKLFSDLIDIARVSASKYPKSDVTKLINPDLQEIIEELLQSHNYTRNKEKYYQTIIDSIIMTNRADTFVIEISKLIQKLAVSHLHVLGDIFDRGNGACRIIDTLMYYHSVDITWGNHDILYIGAGAGNYACVANVIRNSCRYNHLSTIEDGYGISLRPLVTFAIRTYGDDECLSFIPSSEEANATDDYDLKVLAKMHKAITIIQFKLEGKLIQKHPNYQEDKLRKLDFINFDKNTIILNGQEYLLSDSNFPTINKKEPCKLTKAELEVIDKLSSAFSHSDKFQRHIKFLLSHGSMYLKYNNNLLFHGCIPTNENGKFTTYYDENGQSYQGKAFLDYCDKTVRAGYFSKVDYPEKKNNIDFFWFLWCCSLSPLYGKNDITTFERYFLDSESARKIKEVKNPYYQFINNEAYCHMILKHFGLNDSSSVIINGHMPVNMMKGESPVKANGKALIIDGGISKAYYHVTGISGYTLLFNSHGLTLTAHEPFNGTDEAINNCSDIVHSSSQITSHKNRLLVKHTDRGRVIQEKITALNNLLQCYYQGIITPKE